MMDHYEQYKKQLRARPKTWLITGVAGFIGSNLLEFLLNLEQQVVGLDNFSTGFLHNLDEVQASVSYKQWQNFSFYEGDICQLDTCRKASKGVDYVLHQAALGSIPRSIDNPIATNASNVSGFLNMLFAAKENQVASFTYAASSSTYGDTPTLPRVEGNIGRPLSPYAVTKLVNELYAEVFQRVYGFRATGLRYFNVFGPRQNPAGAYAAVIPKWVESMLKNEPIYVNGDGETSRDFCFIENVIQANVLAAMAEEGVRGDVYNVALSYRTTLNQLLIDLKKVLEERGVVYARAPIYRDTRIGDVKHSQADISKIQTSLGYSPNVKVFEGLNKAVDWYVKAALVEDGVSS